MQNSGTHERKVFLAHDPLDAELAHLIKARVLERLHTEMQPFERAWIGLPGDLAGTLVSGDFLAVLVTSSIEERGLRGSIIDRAVIFEELERRDVTVFRNFENSST